MWTHSIVSVKPMATSAIMTNNLSVSFITFAGGITFGLLTLFTLFNNGIMLGVIGTACHQYGMSVALWSFVAAHGSPAIPGKPARGKTKPEEPAYGLVAYGRGDGKVLWEATLPGEPLMDGLSIARDGTVLVRLLDGALVAVGSEGK